MTNADTIGLKKSTGATSRLIIKNLPSKITSDQLRKICGNHGLVTDCQLKYTSSGKFRNFAFVGFRTLEEADAAKNYLNNTFIGSSRVQVEYCQRLEEKSGTKRKPKDNTGKTDKCDDSAGIRHEILLENLPRGIKKKTLRYFITPVKPTPIDISPSLLLDTTSTSTTNLGASAIVKVAKKSEANMLLKLNGRFFGGCKINVRLVADDIVSSEDVPTMAEGAPEVETLKRQTLLISETGRLFVRNIAYVCSTDDVRLAFEHYGPLADLKMPLDQATKQDKGYAMISYVLPENTLRAYAEMDGTVFHGRMLHIIAGEESREEKKAQEESRKIAESSSFKSKKALKQSATAASSHNWNSLFLAPNAVADVLVEKLNTEKSELLNHKVKASLGVRMALGETQLIKETKNFLEQHGVYLESFNAKRGTKRSSTVILVKNLPAKTSDSQLRLVFEKYGELGRLVLPPSGISALVEFMHEEEAKRAFKALAYKKFKNVPLFLEWAPNDVFSPSTASTSLTIDCAKPSESDPVNQVLEEIKEKVEEDKKDSNEEGAVVFVKNLNFNTTDSQLSEYFSRIGSINYATVAKKKSIHSDELLSMGYGFVEFKRRSDALKALKILQHESLDGFSLELKLSDRPAGLAMDKRAQMHKRRAVDGESESLSTPVSTSTTKLLVKNVPFQATRHELENLFKTFGELRNIRLPKKSSSSTQHRGFAFVDFCSESSAKKAFDALKLSTHLYGRRLVLEWAASDENLEDLRAKVADYNLAAGENLAQAVKRQKIMLTNLEQ